MQTVSGLCCQCCCYSAPQYMNCCVYIVLTSFPHTLSIITGLSTKHSLVPGTAQVSDLLSTRRVHITMHLILLGAPVTSLQIMRTKSNLMIVHCLFLLVIDHLDKRELAGALVTISDHHLTIVIHPAGCRCKTWPSTNNGQNTYNTGKQPHITYMCILHRGKLRWRFKFGN